MIAKRKIFSSIVVILMIGFIIVFTNIEPINAKEETNTASQTDIYSEIDQYLQTCVKNAHIPAMSISIVNKTEVLLSKNYGQCKSSDTPFLLGSVSKSFTAVCIMQLVEQQKIDLNATISTYLPNATDGNNITVRQLLNHTSGLGEHQTLKNYKIINKQGIHSYANVNYTLLGEIIEVVSGRSYYEYISNHLFEPLGLSHTSTTYDESLEKGLIDGYTNYWGIPLKTKHRFPTSKNDWITVPAGYLSASSNDLGKYLQMYLNEGSGILSKESIHTMLYEDTVYVEGDIPFWYGYGWAMVKEPLSEPVFRHSGLVETGTTCVFILPERDMAIAIETNINDYFVTNEMMDSLGWGVVLMLLGESPNKITNTAYILNHLWIDLMMLIICVVSILPWRLLPLYSKRMRQKSTTKKIILLILFHIALPIILLLLVPVGFATPLWVAKAFVPDVFITLILSTTSLIGSGVAQGVILYKQQKEKKSFQTSCS